MKYFNHNTGILELVLEDLTKEERENWENYAPGKRKTIRKRKLETVRDNLYSKEIIKFCKSSPDKEYRRQDFYQLLNLFIKEMSK